MNSKQSSRYSMIRRVLLFLKKSSIHFTALPVMNDLATTIENNLNEIDAIREKQAIDITGLRMQKDNLRKIVQQKAVEISHVIHAYAKVTKNEVLAHESYYSFTDFIRMRENDLDTILGLIYKSVEANKENLTGYGITAAKIADFKNAIEDFKEAIGSPKGANIDRKQFTSQLATFFEVEMETIKKVDLMMDTFKHSDPLLYNEYRSNRKVTHFSGSLKVNANVTDAETGKGISGVKVVFMIEETVVLEKMTSAAGGLNVKSLARGSYTVSFSKIGYHSSQVPMILAGDSLVTLNVSLTKHIFVLPAAQS